ncbi:MAG: low-specificity L-threonine aldolase [Pseudomonadales bacterium]|nr:low-specificity L-threonine aldolase [Pseudomonadales bacterium]MDP6472995.1 low-specificity L-threonine aldolase [Pseudomonadales bacterium]MDP6826248.1 low-specificity L-threonine aldolase [Pseudomonadales bacterium]MDP6970822.1 low-specificity L-threonine aldolase [Pseudomonadales bacterium]
MSERTTPFAIDLRSDTLTRPCVGMRRAMSDAEVGDDVFGDDPTVHALEARITDLLGTQSAVFLPSGTQSNLVALLAHCQRGDEYIVGHQAHTYRFEGGGAAVLGSIQPQPLIADTDGSLKLDEIEAAIKPDDPHFARTRLICLENTHDGHAIDVPYFRSVRALADRRHLSVHLDGARLFNASIELGVEVRDIAQHCDSVSVCLSKGLGAPVGSVLGGTAEFIREARKWRKMVGGGMRQAGVIAAAGLYALEHNIRRLADDHDRAARLASVLRERWPGQVEQQTNMIFLKAPEAQLAPFLRHMRAQGVLAERARWVVHLDVSDAGEQHIARAIRSWNHTR